MKIINKIKTIIFIGLLCVFPMRFASAQVDIAQQPVFGDISMPPNLLINLSVEFPTVGSAYRSIAYTPANAYLGYFNPNKCYTYDTTKKYFSSSADTSGTNRTCTSAFSGNFLNYSTMSAIDTFRYGLTGGNRIVDTASVTVLQRSRLPDTFYNSSSNFPSRTINAGSNIAPNLITPFANTTVYVANCGTKVFFGTSNTGSCSSPGNNGNLGSYEVAVQVCDSSEGAARNDLCALHEDSNYKPVGEIQRNAIKMRFGVMGYLLDNSRNRYGGVLRAPMKYAGDKEITITGGQQNNTKKEWDNDTGVFVTNPETASEGISGVINYINKFGSVNGYKTYDPIGELYYEGLRYLMGLQPTAKAVSGMTTAMKDGFPVLSSWSDPMQASCQQSYTITVGDTNTWDDRELPGNTLALSNDAVRGVDEKGLNATTQTNLVGALEGRTTLSTDVTGAGNAGFLMVGAAYWAHTNDIRPDAANPGKVKQIVTSYAFDVDESSGTSYANRQLHLLAKYGSFNDANNDKNPFKTVDSSGVTVTNNTEWEDSTNAGFSAGYFLASNPDKMLTSLRKVFSTIASDPGSGAAASPSNPNVTSGDRYVFSSRFIGNNWTGEIFRQSIDLNTGVLSASDWNTNLTIKASSATTDAVQIPASFTAAGSDKRRIYMWDGTATTNKLKDFCPSGTGIGCATTGGTAMTTAEKAYLDVSVSTRSLTQEGAWTAAQKTAATSDTMISYIRGRKDLEIGTNPSQPLIRKLYRARAQVLGDVVNSEAIYVKQPLFNYNKGLSGTGYLTYKTTARAASLYVGANDGMLHAINADTGAERWAYIPPQVMPNLWHLADSGYGATGGHRYFVDGTPTVGDVKNSAAAWKTILVGGLGAGGNGFYAMDVTDPVAPKALWNICTSSDCNVVDSDMGLSFGQPIITRVNNAGVSTWVVLLTSGHNNSTGIGYLYVLDAMTGAVLKKISTGVGTATNPSGLTKVAAWTDDADKENITKWVYGGDLSGNLWRFDLNNIASASVLKLAVLKDPSGTVQSVTTTPELGEVNNSRVIYVSTGRLINAADLLTTQVQTVYAIKDDNVSATLPTIRDTTSSGTFVQQIMTDSTVGGLIAKDVVSPAVVDWDTKNGWYVDLATATSTGERVSVDMSLDLGTLSVVTNKPKTGVCVAGGESWIYYFNFKTGTNVVTGTTTTAYVGKKLADALGTRPVVVRLPNGKIVSIIRLTNNTTLTQDVPIATSTSAGRRINWRELQD